MGYQVKHPSRLRATGSKEAGNILRCAQDDVKNKGECHGKGSVLRGKCGLRATQKARLRMTSKPKAKAKVAGYLTVGGASITLIAELF
jgi:hypothetical protein